MALLTATHPSAQECWTNDDILASDRPTWAHALGAAGYRPALIGRLHALGPDQLHGFVHREIGDHSPNWPGVARHDLGVLARANDPWPESLTRSGPGRSSYELKDEETSAAASAFLERFAASAREHERFALHVGFMLPHPPYVCAEADFSTFAGRLPLPRLAAPAREHPWLAWWRANRGLAEIAPADALRARTAYYGLVAGLDRMIGRILAALEATGLARNTLVIYASDHGDHLGERGLWWKHTLLDESVKVPLILTWPGHLPAGERRENVVSLLDLAPTILEALGAPPLLHAAGRSFLPLARNAAAAWHGEAFAEYCTDAVPAWTGGVAVQQRMLRAGSWKLCYYHGYPPQLFNLAADPDEINDLAGRAECAAVRERLTARLFAGWDPEHIRTRMAARRRDKDLLAAWAAEVEPESRFLWPLTPEQNRLEKTMN